MGFLEVCDGPGGIDVTWGAVVLATLLLESAPAAAADFVGVESCKPQHWHPLIRHVNTRQGWFGTRLHTTTPATNKYTAPISNGEAGKK